MPPASDAADRPAGLALVCTEAEGVCVALLAQHLGPLVPRDQGPVHPASRWLHPRAEDGRWAALSPAGRGAALALGEQVAVRATPRASMRPLPALLRGGAARGWVGIVLLGDDQRPSLVIDPRALLADAAK